MITEESLDLFKQLQREWETIESAIVKCEAKLTLQEARRTAWDTVYQMWAFFNRNVNEGIYDDILGDIHAMIDRTQQLMVKESETTTVNQ